jgi:hypothetical protein
MLPRDTLILAGSDLAFERMREEYPHHTVLRRDTLTDEDYADWTQLTLREVGVFVLDGNDRLQRQVDELSERIGVNKITSQLRSRVWIEHLLRNLHYLWECPCVMAGTMSAPVPAFIVGAGPSLTRNAHELSEPGGAYGLVFKVNSAGQHVVGDVRDIAVCIESNDVRHKLRTGLEARAFGLTCDPLVMAHGYGRLLPTWHGELGGLIEQMTGIPRLPTSCSGTTAAVSLARRLGCSPIILVGQDLAWTDGRCYAGTGRAYEADGRVCLDWGDVPEHRRAESLPTELDARYAPAWGGEGEVLTSPMFLGVREWLGRWAALHEDVRTYNCTEGGLHIPGWTDVKLRDVLDVLPPVKAKLIAAPPIPRHVVRRWVGTQLDLLRDSPENSMLLDYWLAECTITMLDEWRQRGTIEHLTRTEELWRELLHHGSEELGGYIRSVVDCGDERVAEASA